MSKPNKPEFRVGDLVRCYASSGRRYSPLNQKGLLRGTFGIIVEQPSGPDTVAGQYSDRTYVVLVDGRYMDIWPDEIFYAGT